MSEEIVTEAEPVTESIVVEPIETVLSDYQVAKKLIQLKQSADSRSLDFDLKFTTVKRLLSAKKCYYTGTRFTPEGPFSRSIDRVDSSLGYIDDNVVACTVDINGKKNNLTIEDISIMYKKITQFENKKTSKLNKED